MLPSNFVCLIIFEINPTIHFDNLSPNRILFIIIFLHHCKLFGHPANGRCSLKYTTMAPDLNYKPNSTRCSAHVPSSSSSSSSNSKQPTVKCTPKTADLGYSGHPSMANGNLSKSGKCLECCSVQHERSNRSQTKKATHFKSSANEFGQSNGGQSYSTAYRNCAGKCPEKCGADKCNERCGYEKHNNDRCNDKYSDRCDRPDRHDDKCTDRYGDKFAADKCPERYSNGNCYQDKHQDKYADKYPDKHFGRCVERCDEKADERAAVYDKQCDQPVSARPAADKQSADNKQSNDDELTPYEKVLRGLKKRARHRTERKEDDYVGMYRLRKEIGNGNFSQVFIGAHCLTKGS